MRMWIVLVAVAAVISATAYGACPTDCKTRHRVTSSSTPTGVHVTCGQTQCPADQCTTWVYDCQPSSGCNKCVDGPDAKILECTHYVCTPDPCTAQTYNTQMGPSTKTEACPQ